jgi:hypothetical protein
MDELKRGNCIKFGDAYQQRDVWGCTLYLSMSENVE